MLDIGSGWGGLALFLARHAGADVTGIKPSVEQQRKSTARTAAAGLSDRVRFHLRDYRQEPGRYDRIVSVGMFEHVGRGSYGAFFAALRGLLREDGVALLHSIGDSAPPGPTTPFICKRIFPGGYIPSLSETLRHWRERFARVWEFCLALSETGFRSRANMVFQMQLAKRLDAPPLTRDCMMGAERPAAARAAVPDAAAG